MIGRPHHAELQDALLCVNLSFDALSTVASAQSVMLPFVPVDASYSTALSRLIMISGNPNVLHIYDPVAGVDTPVTLVQPPLALSVSPDGMPQSDKQLRDFAVRRCELHNYGHVQLRLRGASNDVDRDGCGGDRAVCVDYWGRGVARFANTSESLTIHVKKEFPVGDTL